MPPTCTAPGAEQATRVPDVSAHVLPVRSVCWPAVSVLESLKKPVCVGISWSSPWRIPEVECVAG